MLRFFLTRRWMALLLAVIVVGVGCVELGLWQFRRYDERHLRNVRTTANLGAEPVPLGDVMSTDAPPNDEDQWRVVEATGTYDTAHQLLVLYRTRDGAPGVDVVVPLVTDSGAALLVDRGWVQTSGNGNQTPDVPAAPGGVVTVDGWVRISADGSGDDVAPSDGSVRSISSAAMQQTVPYPLYDGFVDLTDETPSVSPAPEKAPKPDVGSGPSYFYGMQWFFFAMLAFGFWLYFGWSEYRQQKVAGPGMAVRGRVSSRRPPAA